jgi:heptosyltransferase-2
VKNHPLNPLQRGNIIMKKILVIRLSSLGDVILTTPLLRKLKEIYPDSKIDFCTKQEYAELLSFNPNISNIIETENELTFSKLRVLKKKLRKEKYDFIIDAHNKLNTFYLRLSLKGKKLVFRKYSLRKFLLVKFKINLMKNLPSIAQRYINILIPLLRGVSEGRGVLPEIYTNEPAQQKVDKLLKELDINGKLICIVPASKHYTKTYPPEMYAELINNLTKKEFSFVLVGKGKDKANIDYIKSKTGNNVFDLCNMLNVLELSEFMKRCAVVISGDSGPMHIAESVGVPIIMLAGSSVREFGFYPQSQNAIVLENNELKCRPCTHIGRSECPLGHFKCMREITTEQILSAIKSI